jgi:type IV secretion system protein VirB9
MIPRRLLLAVLTTASGPALADPRVTTHFYEANEIVTIHGRGDTQSTIAFAPEERIENVAVGDSAGWRVAPNKRADLLFLKPVRPGARSNMTVVTDRRTYLFDLVTGQRGAPVYMLRFTYPAAPRPVVAVVAPEPPVALADAKPPVPEAAPRNYAWASRGDPSLFPVRLFDDGQSTFIAWAKDVPLPAILTDEAKGAEGPVNYTTRGDYVVVDGVPRQIVLRAGKKVATLTPAHHGPVAPSTPVSVTLASTTR